MSLTKICYQYIHCSSKGILYQTKRCFRQHSRLGPTKEEVSLLRQDIYGSLAREKILQRQKYPIPEINNPAIRKKRSALFSEEKEKQLRQVGRVEKIQVDFVGLPENASFLMNKYISTPYNVAQHLGEVHTQHSIIAEVNGQLWDMHRPLDQSCTLRFLTMKMKDEDPFQVNRIFWRSCSMMLGCVIERSFRDHIYVELHSFPSPNVRSGSFVYDADIKLKNWRPNSDEMRVFSAGLMKLSRENLPFERLEVSTDLALKMFEDNKYKKEQIPDIAATTPERNTICLYRIGDFVDISKGPMMANTNQFGRNTVTALHPLPQCSHISPTLYRFQGVALPSGFLLNHFAWSLIENRGKKLNPARLPGQSIETPAEKHQNGSSEKEPAAAAAVG